MKKILSILIIILSFFLQSNAQDDKIEFSTRTPRSTIISFKGYLSKNNYDPEKASYTLRGNMSHSKKRLLTIRLNLLLNRYGKLDLSKIPDKKKYENKDGDYKYILYSKHPEIYLERTRGKWLFSEESVNSIDLLYNIAIKKHYKRKSKDVLASNKRFRERDPVSSSLSFTTYIVCTFLICIACFRISFRH